MNAFVNYGLLTQFCAAVMEKSQINLNRTLKHYLFYSLITLTVSYVRLHRDDRGGCHLFLILWGWLFFLPFLEGIQNNF